MSKQLAALALGFAALAAPALAGNVKELTPDTYNDVVGGDKGTLVEFFAPWCGHCKALAPKYEEAATLFVGHDAVLASVDCDAHSDICSKQGVRGYPTLKYFPAGSTEAQDFEGGREVADLVSFVNKKAGTNVRVKVAPSYATAATDASFERDVYSSAGGALVEFYAPWCGHCKKLAPDYEKLGKAYAGEKVAIVKVDATTNPKYAKEFGVTGYPTLMWFSPGSKEPTKYTGGRTLGDMIGYINEQANTEISADGGYNAAAGRIDELDALAAEFKASSSQGEKEAILAKTEAAIATDAVKNHKNVAFAKFYRIAMKRIIEKGDGYTTTEIARLKRMIDSSDVTPFKIAQFSQRVNIVNQF